MQPTCGAGQVTCDVNDASLLAIVGSKRSLWTAARLRIDPAAHVPGFAFGTLSVMATDICWFAVIVPRLQNTVLPWRVQRLSLDAATKVVPAGSGSPTMTFGAEAGPLFFTVSV